MRQQGRTTAVDQRDEARRGHPGRDADERRMPDAHLLRCLRRVDTCSLVPNEARDLQWLIEAREVAAVLERERPSGSQQLSVGFSFAGSRPIMVRSEERRVGKECRSRWSPYH